MTTPKQFLSRRPVLAGLAGLAALAGAGIVFDVVRPTHKAATGPYADLVDAVGDPDNAKIVGNAILAQAPNKHIALREAALFAKERLVAGSLASVTAVDVAHNFLTEANGWVLPITLGSICLLATQSA